jgi:hypothetical protein
MKLLTKAIEEALPPLYTHDGADPEQIPCPLKIFNPMGLGTWYIWEYEPETGLCFGLCCLHEAELGYVSLEELAGVTVAPFNLPLERDRHWSGTAADAARAEGYVWPGR